MKSRIQREWNGWKKRKRSFGVCVRVCIYVFVCCQCGFAESTLLLCKFKCTHRAICAITSFRDFCGVMAHLFEVWKMQVKSECNVVFLNVAQLCVRRCAHAHRSLRCSFASFQSVLKIQTVSFRQQVIFISTEKANRGFIVVIQLKSWTVQFICFPRIEFLFWFWNPGLSCPTKFKVNSQHCTILQMHLNFCTKITHVSCVMINQIKFKRETEKCETLSIYQLLMKWPLRARFVCKVTAAESIYRLKCQFSQRWHFQ